MVKEKRRNSEKRKEKSRDAARFRRSKETEIFTELANCLPLSESTALQLDKASIMRLIISLLKVNDVLNAVGIADHGYDHDKHNCISDKSIHINGNAIKNMRNDGKGTTVKKDKGKNFVGFGNIDSEDSQAMQMCEDGHIGQLYLKALEGMAFILSGEGDFVYLTDNVAKYLGLQQIDVMGQSIYDYIHPCDHEEIREALSTKTGMVQELTKQESDASLLYGDIRIFTIRTKCTLTSKGRSVNLKSAPYKVMKCCGRLVNNAGPGMKSMEGGDGNLNKSYLLVMMEPIPHPSNIEVLLDSSTFLSKHEMDMRFLFCDDRIEELAGFDHKAMVGQSFFDFHHAMDSGAIKKTFKDLFSKGQAVTQAYRMLVANGGYMWLVTQATTINNSRNQKPQCVVCVHYVLSGVEDAGIILSNIQKDLALSSLSEAVSSTPPAPQAMTNSTLASTELGLLPPKLELSTESIFAPKPKDLDSGYGRQPEVAAYLSSNADDLTCLSPTAGEESVLLPFNTPFKTDFVTSPMLPVVNSPPQMLKQEPLALSPSPCLRKPLTPGSPPLQSSTDSSRISSPVDYLNCNMPMEMDSLDRIFASIGDDNGGGMCGKDGDDLEERDLADIDFGMRAPYIPMDGDQDLNLLPPSSTTLFNLSKDDMNPSVFGRTEFVFGPKQSLFEDPKPTAKMNVRDMLGESTAVASIEQPPCTMFLQMKRPLDMNCLEKGPPVAKVARLAETAVVATAPPTQPCHTKGGNFVPAAGNKNSVLLNLLLSGEDSNYGYKVSQKPLIINTSAQNTKQLNRFETLTRQDCEVNAPVKSYKLLQGEELLKALER